MRSLALAALLLACDAKPSPPSPVAVPRDATVLPSRKVSDVRADRRVELLAIVMRLTGTKEYQRAQPTPYVQAVDAHFGAFRAHRAVVLATELRRTKGIGYDAPMQLAVHLDANLAVVNAAELPEIDARWTGVDVAAYASALADFAAVSQLDTFLAAQRPYLARLEGQLHDLLANEDPLPWFDSAFGAAGARFAVVPAPLAGTWNFGTRATVDDKLTLYQLLGVPTTDGVYAIDASLVELLVHEMAHSYVNPVLAKHAAAILPAATRLFEARKAEMTKQAYGDPMIVANETCVRAIVVAYLRARHGDAVADASLADQERRGFVGIAALASLFGASGPSLDARMPDVIRQLDAISSGL